MDLESETGRRPTGNAGNGGAGEATIGLRYRLAGTAGSAFLRGLGSTLRFDVRGREHPDGCRRSGIPFIFAFWHRWILSMAYFHRNQGFVVLVSEHGDGQYITSVIERMGYDTTRGSSTRGGVKGLKGLVRAVREGRSLGITPDGPRGPARVFKPGALVAAQLTGAPIVPIAVACDRTWEFDSWDRFVVPKPFARMRVRYGAPHYVPREATERDLPAHAREIEGALGALDSESVVRETGS